ncbi:MAG: hypothetical protein FWH55_05395 [Oscillospiraceae bacterium]|nr:hypothetical protein [Oscillospiraceae bacterium]
MGSPVYRINALLDYWIAGLQNDGNTGLWDYRFIGLVGSRFPVYNYTAAP